MAEDQELESEERLIEFEPDFRFADTTVLEADGEYKNACQIMRNHPKPWCLRSRVTLIHPFGMCEMTLQFNDDGSVLVVDFGTSNPDPVSNYDLRCLNTWCARNGWSKPQPTPALVRHKVEFWRHMWTVNMVDSPYLDDRYGGRVADEPPKPARKRTVKPEK